MTWTSINGGSLPCFELTTAQKLIASLKFNEATGSIRLEYGEKRLFFIHPKKNVSNSYLFTNVYGYEVGEFSLVESNAGTLQVGNTLYLVIIEQSMVSIYDNRNELMMYYTLEDITDLLRSASMIFASVWAVTHSVAAVATAQLFRN